MKQNIFYYTRILNNFHDTRDYVRKVLGEQIELTADKEDLKNVNDLPDNHTFFWYQNKVNNDINSVPSHMVIDQHQKKMSQDYRAEVSPNAVAALRDRTSDNVTIARTKQKEFAKV